MKNHTDTTLAQINKIVSPEFCKKMAIKTGFVKRCTSRLNGFEFVKTMILGSGEDSLFTYKKRLIQFNPQSKLSAPGLSQRINQKSAEDLMLNVLSKCLTHLYERVKPKLKNINRILIQDSTCLALNKKLVDIYSGSGGHYKNSGVKIDCIYDYTNEAVLDVEHYARVASDVKNGASIFKYLEPKDLVLRDLGYFKIEELNKISERGAFYVSRLKVDVSVYLRFEDKKPLTFIEFLKKKLKRLNFLDCYVYIGKNKQKVRLIINKLPTEAINKKLRRAKREAKVGGTNLSDLKKALLSYTILITNIPADIASCKEILMLYRIRWRIELIFKEWKSQINIENIKGTNIHRIRCLIYSRICLILIMNKLTTYLSHQALSLYQRELSVKKTLDVLLKDGQLLKIFLAKRLKRIIEKIINETLFELLKGKRSKRKTSLEVLMKSKLVA